MVGTLTALVMPNSAVAPSSVAISEADGTKPPQVYQMRQEAFYGASWILRSVHDQHSPVDWDGRGTSRG